MSKLSFCKKNYSPQLQFSIQKQVWCCGHRKKMGKKVYGALYLIPKAAERTLDIYEEYPTLYKKMFFKYGNKKVMTYIMPKKTKIVLPTDQYLNTIKQGYKDCKLSMKSLNVALLPLKHLQRR